jgi:predicted GNAT family acetyltransferase
MAAGTLRLAAPEDVELIARWIRDFNEEALGERVADPSAATSMAEDLVARRARAMYLWEDVVPVAMAAAMERVSPNGAWIGGVYTPPERRRSGYASALVSQVSRVLLDGGSPSCVLFADVANPTSNHIYLRMGYQPAGPFDDYSFGR